MRSPTRQTRSLIERMRHWLWRPEGGGDHSKTIQALNEIGLAGDPQAIHGLVGLLSTTKGDVATCAAATIHQIIDACGGLEIATLDASLRDANDWQWPKVLPGEVYQMACGLTGTVGVLSCHPNGHVREAAVRELAAVGDGSELPFLLIRLNDWVTTVREAARSAMAARIVPAYAAHFVNCLPMFNHLRSQGRSDHRETIAAVTALMTLPECRGAMEGGLDSVDRTTRRIAFDMLRADQTQPVLPIIERAMKSEDNMIRLRTAQLARQRLDGEVVVPFLELFWRDSFMPVRRESLYAYIEKLPEKASEKLHAATIDSHTSMRELARFYLKKAGTSNFAQIYRDLLPLAKGKQCVPAIAGLGETGERMDLELLRPFLNHASPPIRRAAVRAIARIDGDREIELLLAPLRDQSPSVYKAARDAIRLRPGQVTPEGIWKIWEESELPHVRMAVLSLLAEFSGWGRPLYLLRALAGSEEKVRAKAAKYLGRWHREPSRFMGHASALQLDELTRELAAAEPYLDRTISADMRSGIDYVRRNLA
jgi:HEAT repeat protein